MEGSLSKFISQLKVLVSETKKMNQANKISILKGANQIIH